jgi:predicted HicB family RNase H-like nuclease
MSELKEEKREATSIKIKPQVWKDAKIEAIKQGVTVSELVEEALENWIDKQARIREKKGEH